MCIQLLLLLATFTGVQQSPWSTRSPMGMERQEVAVAAVGEHVYVAGGFDASASIVAIVERYDTSTDNWEVVAPLPTPLHHAAACGLGGKLFVVGGWPDFFATPQSTLYEYDPSADSWTVRASLPAPAGSPAGVAHAGRFYVAGGFRNGASVQDFAVYDPTLDSWSTLAPLPTARNHLGLASVGQRIVAIGGRTALAHNNVDATEIYDPSTDSWQQAAAMTVGRSGLAVAAAGGYALAFGGEGNHSLPSGVYPDVDAYDPQDDLWFPLTPLPTPRHGFGAALVGHRLYLPGGGALEGFDTTPVNEVYDTTVELGAPVPALSPVFVIGGACGLLVAALFRLRRR